MKNILRRIFNTYPNADIYKLLRKAEKYPRYTPHRFKFRELELSVADFISVAWQLKEIFIDEEMKFIASEKNSVIIDCGSNVGVSVIYFRKNYPYSKILAFEASPEIFKCLNDNLRQNNILDAQIFEKAIWIDDKGVSFGEDGADGGSILSDKNIRTLPSIRLKDVLKNESEIDLLKMDIEGAEVIVLQDCDGELKKVKNIYVEYHSWKNQRQELDRFLKLLSDNGFRYYIQSTGMKIKNPFLDRQSDNPMDIQLNIHATKDLI